MLDHIGLVVSDLERSKEFFRKALAPLGHELLMEFPGAAGFGSQGKPFFWIGTRERPGGPVHVAFHCKERALVDRFHAAALEAGGRDNGKPGIREIYHPSYYGAFVLDPDGNNIEAVCHEAA